MPANDITALRNYPLPYEDNFLDFDVLRLIAALQMIDTDIAAIILSLGSKADDNHGHTIGQVNLLTEALDDKADKNHPHALGDLSDVSISGAMSGQFLKFVGDAWVPGNITAGDFSFLAKDQNLSDLADKKTARKNLGVVAPISVGNTDTNLAGTLYLTTTVFYTTAWTANRIITLPLALTRNRGESITFRDPNNRIGSFVPVWQAQGSDSISGQPTFHGIAREVVLVSDGTSTWTVKEQPASRSGCVLSYYSASVIELKPAFGNTLNILGVDEVVPAAGINLPSSSLLPNVTYFIYATRDTAGTWSLQASGSYTPITNAYGIKVHPSNPSWSLVGLIRTNASGEFVDTPNQRHVRTWYNDRGVKLDARVTADWSTTSTAGWNTVGYPNTTISVLLWVGEIWRADVSGTAWNSTAGQTTKTGIMFGGSGIPSQGIACNTSAIANANGNVAVSQTLQATSSNVMSAAIGGVVTGGTGTWMGSAGGNNCTAIYGSTSGSGA